MIDEKKLIEQLHYCADKHEQIVKSKKAKYKDRTVMTVKTFRYFIDKLIEYVEYLAKQEEEKKNGKCEEM